MRPVLLAGLLVACTSERPSDPHYDPEVASLLAQHCERCHNSGGRMDGGVELDTWVAARSTALRIACTSADADVVAEYPGELASLRQATSPDDCGEWDVASMPPGALPHLSREDQRMLVEWYLAGAPE